MILALLKFIRRSDNNDFQDSHTWKLLIRVAVQIILLIEPFVKLPQLIRNEAPNVIRNKYGEMSQYCGHNRNTSCIYRILHLRARVDTTQRNGILQRQCFVNPLIPVR